MSKDRTRYTEVHEGLWDNRKFRRLMRILGVEETTLVGILVAFWQVTQNKADVESGRLPRWDHIDIAEAARWKGDPQKLVDALIQERWIHKDIDGTYRMHEWEHYGGAGWTKKKDAAERTAASRMGLSVAQYRELKRTEASPDPEQLVLKPRDTPPMSRDVTVTDGVGNSHISGKQRDVTRDRSGSDPNGTDQSGSDPNGTDQSGTEGGEAHGNGVTNRVAPQSSVQPVDRSRQNPLPTRPHGAHFDSRGPIPLNGAGQGFMENRHTFPQSPEELIAKHPELAPRFKELDGESNRPSLLEAVRAHWPHYLTVRAKPGGGHESALSTLILDLAKDAKTHSWSWKQDGVRAPERKFKHTDLYNAVLPICERKRAVIPPNPAQDMQAWMNWMSLDDNKRFINEAKKILSGGAR